MEALMSIHKRRFARLAALAGILLMAWSLTPAQTKGAQDARGAVRAFFDLLKAQQYAALYDYLPSEMRRQVTREQMTQGLKRLGEFIVIERMEIGRVQQRGDFAVVDTTIYGRLQRPLRVGGQQVEQGKVTAQQYLFKESGRWKVATADSHARAYFLKRHPGFNQEFQFTPPQFFIKQDGRWRPIAGERRKEPGEGR
jgi:hypothetical protein